MLTFSVTKSRYDYEQMCRGPQSTVTYNVDTAESLLDALADTCGHEVSVLECVEEPRYTTLQAALGAAVSRCYFGTVRNSWHVRERDRFTSCGYVALPQSVLDKLSALKVYLDATHFLHRGKSGGDMIAYTESEAKGFMDKQKPLAFGRYLKLYHADKLSDPAISDLVQLYRAEISDENSLELLLATSREDVLACYEPPLCAEASEYDSCMINSKFASQKVKPCEVYVEHTQLAIAYVKRSGEVIARTLVRTDTKKWLRCYVTAKQCQLLAGFRNLLATQGYTEDTKMLRGVVLPALGSDGNIMPYLDGYYQNVERVAQGWRVGNDGEETSTSGYVDDNRASCADCSDSFDTDDGLHTQHGEVCSSCAENYRSCDDCGNVGPTDDMTAACDSYVCDRCLSRNYTQCEECSEWTSNNDRVSTADGYVCDGCYSDNYSTCDECSEAVKNEDIVNLDNDTYELALCQNCHAASETTSTDSTATIAATLAAAAQKFTLGEYQVYIRGELASVKGWTIAGVFGIRHEGGEWPITHLPSGYLMGIAFKTKIAAQQACERFLALDVPWMELRSGNVYNSEYAPVRDLRKELARREGALV